ncbi:MAG: hypothetical protein M3165_05735, partial [Actinomycetota bacterium]|nr:hypothetical protein [Actinomycetota bacterium]
MSSTTTGGPRRGAHQRLLLLGVLAVQLVGDTALAPYFPQLFRRLFGLEDLAATGTYLWVCRVTGLLALPLWAMAARRFSPQRLVVCGLWLSAVLDLLLGLAPTWTAFTVLSAVHVAASASLALAYPVLVAACGGQGMSGVRAYVALFHLTMLGSTAIGALVLSMPEPRVGISAFAAVDAALAVAAGRLWRGTGGLATPAVADRPVAARRAVWRGVLLVALLAGVLELGAGVVRPFFTEYALHEGLSLSTAATVFALPSVAALLALPAASALHRRLGRRPLLVLSAVVAATGLSLQVVASDLVTLAVGRAVFGAGLGVGQVALDLAVFAAVGTAGPGFIAVEWFRTAALVLIPVLATGAASMSLAAPLAVGAAAFAVTAV